ncbi:hypothetical protein F5888DRAFT_1870140 [Russula emetica]|nr:hypothetical protein F5888DRAFT_1870140 [Russula emetica]
MSSVSKPEILPADDSPICDLPIGHPPAGDPCVGGAGCPSTAGDLPSCNQSIFACTPIHSHYNTTARYGINCLDRTCVGKVLAISVAPYILGPMPPDTFLDRFLPLDFISIPGPPSFQTGMFTNLLPPTNATGAAGVTKKPTSYKALKDSLQTHLPALDVCITAWLNEDAQNSFPFKIRPNCSVYAKEISPESTNSSLAEFFIEHKSQPSMDPFIGLKRKPSALRINPFVKDSKEGLDTLGQITNYVTSHLGSQFWTHMFFVLIVHNES